jgi:hypothetical protein
VRATPALLILASCAVEVPTQRMRIEWHGGRHGAYQKGGVQIEGWTCGEQYQRAVTGVPEAEAMMARCARHNAAYGALLSGFVVLPLAGLGVGELFVHDAHTRDVVLGTGVIVGLSSFALGLVMGYESGVELREAVQLYNGAGAP